MIPRSRQSLPKKELWEYSGVSNALKATPTALIATSPLYMYICASVLDMTLLAQRQIVARPTAVKHGAGGKSSRKENVCTTSQPRRTPAVANAWNLGGGVLMFSSRAPGSGPYLYNGAPRPFPALAPHNGRQGTIESASSSGLCLRSGSFLNEIP